MRGTVENSAISHQNEYPMHVSDPFMKMIDLDDFIGRILQKP